LEHIIDLALTVVGPVLIVYSIFSFVHTRYFVRHCAETVGEVIRLERSYSGGQVGGYEYAQVFSFSAADGRSYTVTSDVSSSPAGFDIGEQVNVRYDPKNPNDAKIHTFLQTWGSAGISLFVGAMFLGFGLHELGFLTGLR
jgi:hypothetical protein